MLVFFWLVLVFALGAIVGSYVNVCVARLPKEKSVLWPNSRCGSCFRPVRWYDNLPLFSYWILRGRCRDCGSPFSVRYFLVELLTALGFVGLFYVEVMCNVHHWPTSPQLAWQIHDGIYPWQWLAGFGFHAVLFSFLMAASVCDLDDRLIPLTVTFPGMIVGLAGSVLFPWPWPHTAAAAAPKSDAPWFLIELGSIKEGLYPWPFWGPLPAGFEPGGNWQTGLATGLCGMLAGTLMLRAVGFVFSAGLGKEALGLGDADLMMMAGAFLGWQPVLVAFMVSVLPALFVALFQLVIKRDNSLPFGPSLAVGVLITMLCWHSIAPQVQVLFFWPGLMVALAVVCGGAMFGMSFLLRIFGRLRGSTT